jgi:hypothetical protein
MQSAALLKKAEKKKSNPGHVSIRAAHECQLINNQRFGEIGLKYRAPQRMGVKCRSAEKEIQNTSSTTQESSLAR